MSCMFDQSIIHRSVSYIWPMFNFQIISRFESCVRPSTSADVNENLLSEQGRTDSILTTVHELTISLSLVIAAELRLKSGFLIKP